MIADVLNTFPQFSLEYILDTMMFKEFILWHMQAIRLKYNIEPNLINEIDTDSTLKEIKEKFKYNEKLKRWE